MKSTTSLLTGILILAIGVILIICRNLITGQGIVTVAGILFLLTGIVNIILYVTEKDEDGKRRNRGFAAIVGWLVSLATITLGLCMLIFTTTFNSMIAFLFGLLIVFGALMQLYAIVFGVRRVTAVPAWTYAFPVVMAGLGIAVFTQKTGTGGNDSVVMLLTGIGFLVFGLGAIVLGAIISGAKALRKKAEEGESQDTDSKINKKVPTKELKSLDD